jgi:glyoxylase-like metal-dependent hydrolase (beta-lactamase superfamily II)
MAKISEGFQIVDGVSFEYAPGVRSTFNVCVIRDDDGLSLIDCGMPGSLLSIQQYLTQVGYTLGDIKRIFLTHLDDDHIGAAPEIKRKTGAKIIMHELDAELVKEHSLNAQELEKRFPRYKPGQIEALFQKLRNAQKVDLEVDGEVKGGEKLEIGEGAQVIHTPGHTPGHSCLYLPRDSVLVSGDSLSVRGDAVSDPVPEYTVNIEQARRSLSSFGSLEFRRLISYHDKPLLEGASKAVSRYIHRL